MEYLRVWILSVACGVRDHLCQLTTSNLIIGTECVIRISGDYPSTGKTADIGVEGVAGGYVVELDRAGCSGGGRHYNSRCGALLSQLASDFSAGALQISDKGTTART